MSQSFKDHITLQIIQPSYVDDVTTFIRGRSWWRTAGMTFETVSKLLMGAGSVLSFASGVYQNTNFSFIAGSISTLSVVSLQFSTFCFRESKKSTEHLNRLLKNLQLDLVPELVRDPTEEKEDDKDTKAVSLSPIEFKQSIDLDDLEKKSGKRSDT